MVKKIDHVAIVVRDIDEAVKAFGNMFGFKVSEELEGPGGEFRSVLVSSGGITLEFLQPLKADSAFGRFLEQRGGGLHHVSFATDDITGELKALKAKGTRLINEEPEQLPNARIAFVHPSAAQNVLVELVQRN